MWIDWSNHVLLDSEEKIGTVQPDRQSVKDIPTQHDELQVRWNNLNPNRLISEGLDLNGVSSDKSRRLIQCFETEQPDRIELKRLDD